MLDFPFSFIQFYCRYFVYLIEFVFRIFSDFFFILLSALQLNHVVEMNFLNSLRINGILHLIHLIADLLSLLNNESFQQCWNENFRKSNFRKNNYCFQNYNKSVKHSIILLIVFHLSIIEFWNDNQPLNSAHKHFNTFL